MHEDLIKDRIHFLKVGKVVLEPKDQEEAHKREYGRDQINNGVGVRLLEDENIGTENNAGIGELATHPEVRVVAVAVALGPIHGPEGEEKDDPGGKAGLDDPHPEDAVVEAFVVQAD